MDGARHVYVYRHTDVYARERLGTLINQVMNLDPTLPSIPQFRPNPWFGLPPSLLLYALQQRRNTRAFA